LDGCRAYKDIAGKKAAEKRKRKGDLIMQNLKKPKKVASAVMTNNGIHSLHVPRLLQTYNNKRREASEKLENNATAKKANDVKKIEGVKQLSEK